MTYLEIKCCHCGEKIIVSENDFNLYDDIICKSCHSALPSKFKDDAITALNLIADINRELDKDHREIKTDNFHLNIKFNQD